MFCSTWGHQRVAGRFRYKRGHVWSHPCCAALLAWYITGSTYTELVCIHQETPTISFYLPKFNLCLPYYSRRGERRRWVRLKLGETIRGCFLSHILAKIIVLLVKPPRAVGSGGKGANSDGARGRVGHRESGLEKKTKKKTLCKVIDVGCRGREGNELFHRGSWIEGRTLLCQPFFLTPLHASALPSCLMLPAACQAGSPSTWHSALSTNTQTNEKTA